MGIQHEFLCRLVVSILQIIYFFCLLPVVWDITYLFSLHILLCLAFFVGSAYYYMLFNCCWGYRYMWHDVSVIRPYGTMCLWCFWHCWLVHRKGI